MKPKTAKKTAKVIKNTRFPGRPHYTGPTQGLFGLVHHDALFEDSYGIMERIKYIKKEKKANEIPIRLHNLIYLIPRALPAIGELSRASNKFDADRQLIKREIDHRNSINKPTQTLYKKIEKVRERFARTEITLDKKLHKQVLAYIKKHIPDTAWDEKKGEMVFLT